MKATIIALFGACLVFMAHGVPIPPSLKAQGKVAERSVVSGFSSGLTTLGGVYNRPNGYFDEGYYYQTIKVTAKASGTYTFRSHSMLDTIGYFYQDNFDPSEPDFNLVMEDDDSGDDDENQFQFLIEAYLEAERIYFLVVTTHGGYETGDFSIAAEGPDGVELESFAPTTSRPITAPTTQPTILSSIAGALSSDGAIYLRPDGDDDTPYHYQAIEIEVETSGLYTFTSNSEFDTVGFFYENSFDPSVPLENFLMEDDDSDGDLQFSIDAELEPGKKYILVVTSHGGAVTGDFSVTSHGPGAVTLNNYTPTISRPIEVTPIIVSTLSEELSASSSMYVRPDGDESAQYYYKNIPVSVTQSGMYTFTSFSDMDTIGFLYETSFDALKPTENLLMEDDDSGDEHLQFGFKVYLEAGKTYILVVTTHPDSTTGSFSVSTKGPAAVIH